MQRESDAISGAKHVRRFAMNPLKAIRAPSIDSLNKTPPLSRPVVGAPCDSRRVPRAPRPRGRASLRRRRRLAPPLPPPRPPPRLRARARRASEGPRPRAPRAASPAMGEIEITPTASATPAGLSPRERARPPHLQDLARERRASPSPPPHPLDPSPAIRSPPREPDRTHAARRARRGPAANARRMRSGARPDDGDENRGSVFNRPVSKGDLDPALATRERAQTAYTALETGFSSHSSSQVAPRNRIKSKVREVHPRSLR